MAHRLLRAEEPIILEGERIVATRTITRIPSVFTEAEWAEIKAAHTLHEHDGSGDDSKPGAYEERGRS